jgi:hypothetical protein
MKPGNFLLRPDAVITNARKRSLLATCSAVALALGIAACEQQGQQGAGVTEQGTEYKVKEAGKEAMQEAKKAGKKAMPEAKKAGKKAMQEAKKAGKKAMPEAKKGADKAMEKPSGKTKGMQGAKPPAGAAPAGTTGSRAAKAPSPKFLSLDINGDGQLSADETSGNLMLKKNMKKLDTNGDRQLSPSEFATARK